MIIVNHAVDPLPTFAPTIRCDLTACIHGFEHIAMDLQKASRAPLHFAQSFSWQVHWWLSPADFAKQPFRVGALRRIEPADEVFRRLNQILKVLACETDVGIDK